jgi:GABA(A) receptor-associated protein
LIDLFGNMFKKKYSEYQRLLESTRVIAQHPDKVPIICEPYSASTPPINRYKYLVNGNITVGQFIHIIRPRILGGTYDGGSKALFLFVGSYNNIPPTSALLANVYNLYKDADGFLYITYALENTFG